MNEREQLIARLTALDINGNAERYQDLTLEELRWAFSVLLREARRLKGSRYYANHFNPDASLADLGEEEE